MRNYHGGQQSSTGPEVGAKAAPGRYGKSSWGHRWACAKDGSAAPNPDAADHHGLAYRRKAIIDGSSLRLGDLPSFASASRGSDEGAGGLVRGLGGEVTPGEAEAHLERGPYGDRCGRPPNWSREARTHHFERMRLVSGGQREPWAKRCDVHPALAAVVIGHGEWSGAIGTSFRDFVHAASIPAVLVYAPLL